MSSPPSLPGSVPGDPPRQRLRCPRCASPVRRRRRNVLQRWLLRGTAMARYRCADDHCSWSGLLTRHLEPSPPHHGAWPRRALRGAVPLALAALALLAAQWGAAHAPVADVPIGARLFAPGEAFDGEPLPADHPMLVPAVHATAAPPATGSTAPAAAGLTLRRFCAWGHPGRMPYRGTVEQALRAARLPAAVREQIGAAIAAGRPHDRLSISNDAIRAASGPRTFEAQGFAMTYGRTLCLGTRVNFKPGHAEPANLYEAFDIDGRRYSVMVPDACGNVSVLRSPGDRIVESSGTPGMWLTGADPLDPGVPGLRVMHAALSRKPNEVPAPGTLALSLLALAIAGAVRQHRSARSKTSAARRAA